MAFEGSTTIAGPIMILATGDVAVGAATLRADVIDTDARSVFNEAATLGVPASVAIGGVGSIGTKGDGGVSVVITLDITLAVPAATPAPTGALLPDTAMSSTP